MATLIIEMDGGLVNEVYSTLLEPLNIQVYDTDDRRDPEHAYLYAASIYALQFGGMRPQFRRGHDYSDRIWGALERRPESAALHRYWRHTDRRVQGLAYQRCRRLEC